MREYKSILSLLIIFHSIWVFKIIAIILQHDIFIAAFLKERRLN